MAVNHQPYHHSPRWLAVSSLVALAATGLAVLAWHSPTLSLRRTQLWANAQQVADVERLITPELTVEAGATMGQAINLTAGQSLADYQPAPPEQKPPARRRRQ